MLENINKYLNFEAIKDWIISAVWFVVSAPFKWWFSLPQYVRWVSFGLLMLFTSIMFFWLRKHKEDFFKVKWT